MCNIMPLIISPLITINTGVQFVIKTLKLIEIMFRLRAIRLYLFCTKIILILITEKKYLFSFIF